MASLTIPNVVQKYKEKQTVVRLKKSYATLQNAYRLAQNEYGEGFVLDLDWTSIDNMGVGFMNNLKPFLNVADDCSKSPKACFTKYEGEWGRYYTQLEPRKGYNATGSTSYRRAVLLKDGSLIYVSGSGSTRVHDVMIAIDVNGPLKPNQYGHDTFFFEVSDYTKYKIEPVKSTIGGCQLGSKWQAQNCAYWVLKNENMDYLHCNLNWDTQTKCE